MTFIAKGFLLILSTTLLVACAPTSNITSSYKDKTITDVPVIKKLLVLAMTNDNNRNVQQTLETEFAAQLQEKGYMVETSFEEFGPKAFKGLTEEQALKKIADDGIDGVITVSLLDREKERNYNPGRTTLGRPMMFRNWWGYYNVYYPRVFEPGYYTTSTNYFLETNLYLSNGDKLLYSAQSKTFDPGSAEGLAQSVSRAVIKDMQQKGVIRL